MSSKESKTETYSIKGYGMCHVMKHATQRSDERCDTSIFKCGIIEFKVHGNILVFPGDIWFYMS